MDKPTFVTNLLNKMEEARPPLKSAEEILTDEFMQKHTKFASFKDMVQTAIKESGLMEEYLSKLKESLTTFDAEPRCPASS